MLTQEIFKLLSIYLNNKINKRNLDSPIPEKKENEKENFLQKAFEQFGKLRQNHSKSFFEEGSY